MRMHNVKRLGSFGSEKGVALITVIMISSLVVGLIVLAMTNGMMGNIVASTYVGGQKDKECGQGNLDMAAELFEISEHEVGNVNIARRDKNEVHTNEEIYKIREGGAETADDVGIAPDITIGVEAAASPERTNKLNCQTNADIDKLYVLDSYGYGVNPVESGYLKPIQGKACSDGTLYSIVAQTASPQGNTSTQFRSIYYSCT